MSNDIAKAVEILKRGGLVAFATETVYGLGADATNPQAIAKIFAVKGRPSTNPLIVHIASIDIARKFTADWPASAQLLAETFWPGPLTLVVVKSPRIVEAATAGKQTVGLRVPNHPLALELLKQFNGPLAAPSANRSTRVSPTTAQHVREELGASVDFILDGGPCEVGIESTVLDLTVNPPIILRPGAITREQIAAIIGPVQLFTGHADPSTPASSPGQQSLHYAPRAAAFRFETSETQRVDEWCSRNAHRNYKILYFTEHPLFRQMPQNPADYARVLYSALREVDAWGSDMVLIEMPPDEPQWLAIRDRLLRATRPLPHDI